ncbi:MAG: fused MFS/spermidine synthase [Bacteroidota bacterium]|nr:fused MFS/spermidine synthase [Bacteroidota bacterium]MDP3146085.1 fused MFS/spermidine synthase [Bacteroidota bacterium]MDP3558621.1 fused MFS/spermidine synthase [Bacteroidota bacterium]
MIKKLLFLSFIEGAVVMAAELCGAKLLAPIFGSSLYVWASVMGITLVALALGYFFGGLISEKSKQHSKKLFQILIFASLFVILMPVISRYLIPWISYLPFLIAVVLSTFILLFFPIFFLGATSPLFIYIQTKESKQAGKISGTVYAVSTFGGILATFLCGFYLIPAIGLTYCLMLFGSILFITNIFIFKFYKLIYFILFAAFIYLNLQFSLLETKNLFYGNSILGQLEVLDVLNEKKEKIRILKINNIIQTEMNLETKSSVSDYVKLLDSIVPYSKKNKSALVLGLGGGLTANLFQNKNYTTDGVEFDKDIIDAAINFFDLNKKVIPICSDARYYLNHCNKIYDLVLVDIFKAEEQPSHVLTTESLNQLKNNLNDSALLVINWHGYMKGKSGLGSSILYNTLTTAGFNVKVCASSANENYRNLLFVCSLNIFGPLPFEIATNFETTQLVNTDDLPLFEKYNALANKTWRSNYLNYYQAVGK